jgi:lysophospholipase L1-like esterase
MEKRRISILGDSISTFAGYTPEEAVFYDSYVQWETGVKSVEDTWWMQVIKALDGELGTNHSLAGSMVSGNLSTSAMSYERIEKLGTNGIPDIILISAGCNDWGFCVLPEEFEEAAIEISKQIIEMGKGIGAGFYFMTPFNRVSLVKSILEYV